MAKCYVHINASVTIQEYNIEYYNIYRGIILHSEHLKHISSLIHT